jgi:hypothetical protein
MILATLVLATATTALSDRQVLLHRWQQAARVPIRVQRRLREAQTSAPPERLLRALADQELKTPGRYTLDAAVSQAAQQPSWWVHLWQWIGDRWNALWKAVFSRVHLGRTTLQSIGDVTIVVAALALVAAALRLLALWRKAPSRTFAVRPMASSRSAQDLVDRANALARDGAYAAAARCLFSAMLVTLDAHGVVRDDRSSTVGEVRRCLDGRQPKLIEPFDDVASAFVAGAYAERPVAPSEWERALRSYQSMVSATAS